MAERRTAGVGVALAAAVLAAAAAPASGASPVFPVWTRPAEVAQACDRGLVTLHRAERRLAAHPPDGTFLAAFDDLAVALEEAGGPVGLLAAVHPDAAMRDAADACSRRQQAFVAAFLQNTQVHRRLRRVQPVDAVDARFRQDQLDAFEDAGVALGPRARAQFRAQSRTLARLSQDFERRIRDDRRQVAFTEAELAGVPADVWSTAPREGDGRVRLGLDAPTYTAVVTQAHDRGARERMWRAGLTQGGPANLRTLDRIARLRLAQAQTLGVRSHADLVLRRRMAHDAATVAAFLDSVQAAVARREQDDLAVLQAAQPGVPLARWDVAYLTERVRRERHAVDQEAFRRHFPPEDSLRFVFAVAGRLFGLRFTPQPATLWHPDARAYAVADAVGRDRGVLLVDLYPREGKYKHAAVWGYRNAATRLGRTPAAALVVNFQRTGLDLDELETLLHEFGHALHGLLSETRYAAQGGTNVQLDFVEAPSQMFEDWVYDPAVVALFADVCPACPPVPDGLLARARAAREFGRGVATARQQLFARYDQALHGPAAVDPMGLWQRLEAATPLGHVRGSQFPAGFGHIAGGYAAGYYGYLWSLVIAEDLRTAFAADRLSPDTGARFQREVLAPGGQLDGNALVQRFLGRPASPAAFFNALSRP